MFSITEYDEADYIISITDGTQSMNVSLGYQHEMSYFDGEEGMDTTTWDLQKESANNDHGMEKAFKKVNKQYLNRPISRRIPGCSQREGS